MLNPDQLTELLGRPVPEDTVNPEDLRGRVVLVTGAGGSIGQHLAAKLYAYGLKTLILVEKDEYRLYKIAQKLPGAVPVLADYGDLPLMLSLLDAYAVTDVFHVGAYKHVPLVERNPVASVQNNVLAAYRLFHACGAAPVQSVTVISTDKAVRPTNIMGATKAVVEMMALNYPTLIGRSRIVRFGNVLWTSGSVLPLFYDQLVSHQAVTVTHPDVTRYFMSIQEATSLILHAHQMDPGSYVLDMGKPVMIIEMVQRMARILDVEPIIQFIGLRPGEKLHEELTLGKVLGKTSNTSILKAQDAPCDWLMLSQSISQLDKACGLYDVGAIRQILGELVLDYAPQCGIVDPHWIQRFVTNAQPELDGDDCFLDTGLKNG